MIIFEQNNDPRQEKVEELVKATSMAFIGITEEPGERDMTHEERIDAFRQRNAELSEQVKQAKADMESMRAEFRTRLAEVISKSGIKFDKGSLNNPYEWKPLMLVVKGLYYEHDGVVKRCIDGGIAKDFESRFEAV